MQTNLSEYQGLQVGLTFFFLNIWIELTDVVGETVPRKMFPLQQMNVQNGF